MLKKLLIFLGTAIIAIFIILYFTLGQIIDSVVKSSINTYGPELTQTKVHVDDVSISPFAGNGRIEGLRVGNPPGYKSPNAFTLEEVYVNIQPSSIFSNEVHVNEIEIISPHFVFESNLLSSNIGTIIDNVKKNTKSTDEKAAQPSEKPSGSQQPGAQVETKEPKRFVINRLLVENGVVQLGVLGNSATVKLERIELKNFSPEGITAAQATSKILSIVLEKVIVVATELAANPNETANNITNTAVDAVNNTAQSVSDAIGGLLKGNNSQKE